jgi:type IV pilus assembly protein PilE
MSTTAATRGFTLVECAVVCAMVGVLASVAWPSWNGHVLRAGRLDGVALLLRVQAEQESFRSHHGRYTADLAALRGLSGRSADGRYTLELVQSSAGRYTATARPVGRQQQDRSCSVLTLHVSEGFAQPGPSAACWNR